RAAGHAADPRTDDPGGLTADQSAEQVAEARSADTADGGTRNVPFAGVRVGDASGDTEQRDRGKAGYEKTGLLHRISSQRRATPATRGRNGPFATGLHAMERLVSAASSMQALRVGVLIC